MADKSPIEWTDATWNPVTGCSKVSPGHCYAETLALTRLRGKAGYPGQPWTPENAAANVVLRPERLDQPLRWRRPRRIFVNSLSDLFHEQVPDDFIAATFGVMARATDHTFQVLTKRPDRMRAWFARLRRDALPGMAEEWAVAEKMRYAIQRAARDRVPRMAREVRWAGQQWPLPNVWLGTSVENQRWADARIPELLATPAAVRFLSMEPLLGPVDLTHALFGWCPEHDFASGFCVQRHHPGVQHLGWVIAGGESGPGFRPVDPEWVRSIRDQASDAGVPFLFKQWGGIRSKSGGRELDGRTWDEYPEVRS